MSDEKRSASPASDNALEVIAGGRVLDVTHLALEDFDESSRKRLEKFQPLFGIVERVKVHHIAVSDMQRYGSAILGKDEATAIECYCRRDPGWADTLTPESVTALADLGLELNLPFFSAWFHRQAKWTQAQTPSSILELQKTLANLTKMFTGSPSQSSSGASPSTTG